MSRTINELCRDVDMPWVEEFINDYLDCLPEHGRTKPPKSLKAKCLFDKFVWMCDYCVPSFTPDSIYDIVIDAMQP